MAKKNGKALVVGAGISGIRSALDLAEFGYGVTLIDRAPHMGGILSLLDYQFPTDRCGMCKMLPLVDRDESSQVCLRKGLFHENIDILVSTELVHVDGEPGNYEVTLRRKPRLVDPDKCVGCGECARVCPVEIPDPFNLGMGRKKAIFLPMPHAIPNPYIIDVAACNRCGACETVCPTQAISLSDPGRKLFRILVVDDELIVRDSLKELLEDEGFAVDMAGSGDEALNQLTQQQYHLMLLDIKMPGMDGVEVLKRAKELTPELTVVMMTAYATVETAIEAMKTGALDYLIKPFEPDTLIPMVLKLYEGLETGNQLQMNVGALLLCGGTAYFDPSTEKNTFGYKTIPNVITSLEYERILSGTGPCAGLPARPSDGKPIRKVAWIQCVGSRNITLDADYCSSVCCMHAIKEAMLTLEKSVEPVETAIFYMDMRTFGKSFQRYKDQADGAGVKFIRGRVHSLLEDPSSGGLLLRHTNQQGAMETDLFDLAVLSVGQRPSPGTESLAEMTGIELNPWGFAQPQPFTPTCSSKEGVVIGGSFSGLKDIAETVIHSSAAAMNASRIIHSAGGSLIEETPTALQEYRNVQREVPDILVAVCTCGGSLEPFLNKDYLVQSFEENPAVQKVVFLEQTCTATGWDQLVDTVRANQPNRLLIASCLPYVYARKLKALGEATALDPSLMEVVDILTPTFAALPSNQKDETHKADDLKGLADVIQSTIAIGIARLKYKNPFPKDQMPVAQRALVVGGGIAGMTAAMGIADHGFEVDLVEKSGFLGGNLKWLKSTLEGHDPQVLLENTVQKIEKNPNIQVHLNCEVMGGYGQVGRFITTLQDSEGAIATVEHGATILATGGREASTDQYSFGKHPRIITQKSFEQGLSDKSLNPETLESVVMIQCVGSREEPRNFCSRICCTGSLKHALKLKEINPECSVYVLYRDMTTYGFSEPYFTLARQKGILFIQYRRDNKPVVSLQDKLKDGSEQKVFVSAYEPIIQRPIQIEADLVVLATGIAPTLPVDLVGVFGVQVDQDGFFQEAESKWRPVDSIKEGIFACGLAHSPRSITESIATAEACAQRALRLLYRQKLPAGNLIADVRHSLCVLCERCIETCPYGARTLDSELQKIAVNPAMCQGCGACAAVCPNSASVLNDFTDEKMLDVIDSALEKAL